MRRDDSLINNLDWVTVAIYAILVICGWFCIYGAVYNFEDTAFWSLSERYGKQLVWIGFAFVVATVLLNIDHRLYNFFAYPLYGVGIFLLLVTLVVAPDIKGSRSWLVLGPISLQPAEFVKTVTCLALAKFMSSFGFALRGLRNYATVILIIFLPAAIIILQQETGSALVYLALVIVLYREGMPGIVLFLALCLVIFFIVAIRFGQEVITEAYSDSLGVFIVVMLAIVIQLGLLIAYRRNVVVSRNILLGTLLVIGLSCLINRYLGVNVRFLYVAYGIVVASVIYLLWVSISRRRLAYTGVAFFLLASVAYANVANYAFKNVLQPHQQVRIEVALGMKDDPKKAGYNVNQSKIAIGSGGVLGKGFLNGTQTKLKYVPEQDTDFIFCTVGEEHGFVGSLFVLLMFSALLLRLLYLAERQRSDFSRIYGYCVASIIFFHLAINIGMVIGLTPVIGIPLPFFSYGGSSLWGFTILLFIFLRLDASRMEYMK